MSVTQPIMTDEQPNRREVFAAINAGIDAGLPVPWEVRILRPIDSAASTANIDLGGRADLEQWLTWFGMQSRDVTTDLYPDNGNPDRICSRVWSTWRGWHLGLNSRDLIAGIADAEHLHYLEPGSGDGDLSNVLACGLTVATSGSGYVKDEARVTCRACRAAAQLDHSPECREQLEERPCRFDCEARS